MHRRLLNPKDCPWKHLSCQLLDTWKLFSENITCSCFDYSYILPFQYDCSYDMLLLFFARPRGSLKLQLLLRDLFGPHICSCSPLTWALSHPCSELGPWEDILTGQQAKGMVSYIPWQKLYHSCSLSSQFTVTHNQGYGTHCHTIIRDKVGKDRDSPCCF